MAYGSLPSRPSCLFRLMWVHGIPVVPKLEDVSVSLTTMSQGMFHDKAISMTVMGYLGT